MASGILQNIVRVFNEGLSGRTDKIAFYELEGVSAGFLRSNQDKMPGRPLLLELLISEHDEGYIIKFIAYYKDSGKFIALDKIGEFSTITLMPEKIKGILTKQKEVKIKTDDMAELLSVPKDQKLVPCRFHDIEKEMNHFERGLISRGWRIVDKTVRIEDKLFKTAVQLKATVLGPDGKELKFTTSYYTGITDLPDELSHLLEANGEVDITV